jgi:Zn-dependent protease with chaperone function
MAATCALVLATCAIETGGPPGREPPGPPTRASEAPKTVKVDQGTTERLQRLMTPLLAKMNKPIPVKQVKMAVVADPRINAANAGGGQFMVTTGLLERATDNQLFAILAHEVAHEDLGHVAKTQALATGVEVAMVLLDQIYPGASSLTPVAGQLVVNAYTRKEESEADAHAVEIMKRAGHDGKSLMAGALTWIARTEGASGGGFFATHPATGDRIRAVRELP